MDLDLHHFARLLQTLNTRGGIHQGRQLHVLFLKRGLLNSALMIGNRLLQMYTKYDHLVDARRLFDEMPERNCFTWNTMIEGYMKLGNKGQSLNLFHSMPHKNDFSWNLVVSGFVKADELEIARELFENMPRRNGIAWNCMIHGYAKRGYPSESLKLFMDLNSNQCDPSRVDTFILATAIGVCTDMLAFELGKQIHARIVVNDVQFDSVLSSSLVNMYAKGGDLDNANHVMNIMRDPDDFSLSALISGYASCGRMNDARRIFNLRTQPCVVLWNTLISGYIANDAVIEALVLYTKMRRIEVQEDSSTFASILSACSSLCVTKYTKQMHAHTYKFGNYNDLIVVTALVDAYAKCHDTNDACKLFSELSIYDTILLNSMITIYSNCGRIEDAKMIFDTMPYKTLISWNSMTVGFSQNGCPIEALDLFLKMNKIGLRTDKFSLGSAISACASISSLELGEQIFCRATIIGLIFDHIVSTSLVDFYCKCGYVEHARKLFEEMPKPDEVPWNAMLMGYATNGYGNEALNLFDEMRRLNISPTDITFTAVLSACDHCGLVEGGEKWFYLMRHYYKIDPGIEHYSCMVDLFARANVLEKAISLIEEMPFDADASMWSSVLRGCVAHGNKILGKIVAEKIRVLEPENSGAYVQLSSIFATSGDWESSAEVRKLMRDKKIRKNPGRSWGDS